MNGTEAGGMLPHKGKGPTESTGRSDHKRLKYKYRTTNQLHVKEAGSLNEVVIEQRSKGNQGAKEAVAQLPQKV